MKNLRGLKFFLGINVARSEQDMLLSQRKYVLDFLSEIGMLEWKPANTPIIQNHHLGEYPDQKPTNKERYERLVGKLIYLSQLEIFYAMCVVGQFTHCPSEDHIDAAPRKGLMFKIIT